MKAATLKFFRNASPAALNDLLFEIAERFPEQVEETIARMEDPIVIVITPAMVPSLSTSRGVTRDQLKELRKAYNADGEDLSHRHNKVACIKLVREWWGYSLRAAKDLVDYMDHLKLLSDETP